MKRSPRIRRIALVVALLLAALGPAGARPDENHVDGFAIQFPSSQIEITSVYADGVTEYPEQHIAVPVTCVLYVNQGPKPVVHIQFDFAAVRADGKVNKPEPYDTTGKFAVGVLQRSGDYNCRLSRFGMQVLDGQLKDTRIFGRPAVYRLVTWVNKVVYADGTTWEATPPTLYAAPK